MILLLWQIYFKNIERFRFLYVYIFMLPWISNKIIKKKIYYYYFGVSFHVFSTYFTSLFLSNLATARGWYAYVETSFPRNPNDTAHLVSPSTNLPSSCLHFWYNMHGPHVGKLQVYVRSGGKMGQPVWSRYGTLGDKWYEGRVAVKRTGSYQVHT